MGGKDDKSPTKHRYSSMPDRKRQMDYGKLCPNGIMVNSVYNLFVATEMLHVRWPRFSMQVMLNRVATL